MNSCNWNAILAALNLYACTVSGHSEGGASTPARLLIPTGRIPTKTV
jgi:hypothetical protein